MRVGAVVVVAGVWLGRRWLDRWCVRHEVWCAESWERLAPLLTAEAYIVSSD